MLSKIVAIHTLWPLKLSLQACFNTERFFFKYYFHNIVIISLEGNTKSIYVLFVIEKIYTYDDTSEQIEKYLTYKKHQQTCTPESKIRYGKIDLYTFSI